MCKLINRYIVIRRASSFFIIILILLIITSLIITSSIFCIGGWGIVSDLEKVLKEMEH